jgi:hypothetical protein
VWTYLGPAQTMTPFRDFGTESPPTALAGASKEQIFCNWVQSMDGDMDTAHISNLHHSTRSTTCRTTGRTSPATRRGSCR